MRRFIPALFLALVMCAPARAATIPANTTAILSGDNSLFAPLPAPVNDSAASRQSVSDDGRFVAFTSRADGLSGADDDSVRNVYVKDMATGTVSLASRRDGAAGMPSHADCFDPAIDDNGRRVAFTCDGPLDAADTNGLRDVYMRDITSNETFLVSRQGNGGGIAVGDSESMSPSIDASGRHIAFASSAQNFVTPAPGFREIYVRTIGFPGEVGSGNSLGMASVASNNVTAAQADCNHPSISDDGLTVAFESFASNLVTGDDNGARDVFVHAVGSTVLASSRNVTPAKPGDGESFDPALSGNGRTVVFTSKSTSLDSTLDGRNDADVYVHTLGGGTALVDKAAGAKAIGGADSGAISDDGTVLAFRSSSSNLVPGFAGSGVYAGPLGVPALASRAPGPGAAPADSAQTLSVSGDGDHVLFDGIGSVTGDAAPGVRTLALRDIAEQTTRPVSRPGNDSFGNQGGSVDFSRAVSADGRFVAFVSTAPALGAPGGVRAAVVVRDAETGQSVLASRGDGANGAPMTGVEATPKDGNSTVALSADGNRVAFVAQGQVWVRDIAAGRTLLVSRANGLDGAPAGDLAFAPSISADGNRVAFLTNASNMNAAPGDEDDDQDDAYVRDLAQNQTIWISRDNAGSPPRNGNSRDVEAASISADGDHVAFSTAEPLDPQVTNTVDQVYVRDISENKTRLASTSPTAGVPSAGSSSRPSINRDGTRVAFESTSNFGTTPIRQGVSEVWVHDAGSGNTFLASRADGPDRAPASNNAFHPLISADGHVVAFNSIAPELAPEPHAAQLVYRRNLDAGSTQLVSRAPGSDGAPVQDFGELAGTTADGGCVAFTSGGGLLGAAPGSGDFQQLYLRAFTANCGRPVPPVPTAHDTTPPVLSAVSLSRARFRVGRTRTAISAKRIGRGTTLRFTSSEAGRLTILIERALPGRKRGKACKPVHRRVSRGRCTAHRRTASLTRTIKAGRGRVALTGRIGSRRMKHGAYRLILTARDAAGNTSKQVPRNFKVVPG